MKITSVLNYPILLVMTLVLTGASCKKEKFGIDALPPATQEGKNTFGCLVNGEALLPKKDRFSTASLYDCWYSEHRGKYTFHLSALDSKTPYVKSMSFNSEALKLTEGNFDLSSNPNGAIEARYSYSKDVRGANYYTIKGSKNGTMTITKLDTNNNIISGTFWFNAESPSGEKVEVREGRFDMKY